MLNQNDIRTIELFAGIGGFRFGLEKASSKFKIVWANDIDSYACQIYRRNYGTTKEPEGKIQPKYSSVFKGKSSQYRRHTLYCPELYEGDIRKIKQMTFLTTTCLQVVSLVRVFQSLGKEEDLKILAELSSMKSRGFWPLKDPNYCSWKTSEDFYHTIMGKPLEPSLQPFLNWGIFSNGRYLTARISESPKTGKECSLSDILEENVPDKYFLSSKAVKAILNTHQELSQTEKNGLMEKKI